jgi:hypothetical protein
MPRSALSGTRIRSLRTARRLGQADLARLAGISASYLNLIEHNRRRAGPGLLAALARALEVPPSALDEGSGDALLEGLRSAAARLSPGTGEAPPEIDRAEDMAGRFPGWAALIARQDARIEAQERTLERLADRLAHDPNLSAALHEIVSAVTAVQSTAAILAESDDLDADWRARFHGNIHRDSLRLADAAEALVAFLDASVEPSALASPGEALDGWLTARNHHLPEIETATGDDWGALIDAQPELASAGARALAAAWLAQARADAAALPLARLAPMLTAMFAPGGRFAPEEIARAFGTGLATVFRRLATRPDLPGVPRFGLAVCDSAGALTLRRPIDGFAPPRSVAACPKWPLFGALLNPDRPLRQVLDFATRPPVRLLAHAVGGSPDPLRFDPGALRQATMLLTPAAAAGVAAGDPVLPVGSTCRVCPRQDCEARREPSLVSG